MTKTIISITVFIFLFNVKILPQVNDSTNWINFTNDSFGISFDYPTYFELNPWKNDKKENSVALISYLRYEPVEPKEDYTIYLKLYSTLLIYVSNNDFDEIAVENNLIKKNNKWYDKERQYFKPADTFYFNDWQGLKTITRVSIGTKDHGAWTSDGDIDVYLITKKINNKTIVCYAKGFDFPDGETILKTICSSIK